MHAVILSAGQGKRLLPLTADQPKCAIPIHGRAFLEWQITELMKCGISPIYVVVGFGAATVEHLIGNHANHRGIHTLYNPFYALADNLISCWTARNEMQGDFILLNGDTLFEPEVLKPSPKGASTSHHVNH